MLPIFTIYIIHFMLWPHFLEWKYCMNFDLQQKRKDQIQAIFHPSMNSRKGGRAAHNNNYSAASAWQHNLLKTWQHAFCQSKLMFFLLINILFCICWCELTKLSFCSHFVYIKYEHESSSGDLFLEKKRKTQKKTPNISHRLAQKIAQCWKTKANVVCSTVQKNMRHNKICSQKVGVYVGLCMGEQFVL